MKFDKMLEKKKKEGKEISPMERDAKMGVLGDIRDEMANHMSDRLNGLKKVSVASDSPAGLKTGLEKAKEIVDKMPQGEASPEEMEKAQGDDSIEDESREESLESPEEEASEGEGYEDMSEDEINKKLEELMQLKKHIQSKKV
jgi:hypothetical protein